MPLELPVALSTPLHHQRLRAAGDDLSVPSAITLSTPVLSMMMTVMTMGTLRATGFPLCH